MISTQTVTQRLACQSVSLCNISILATVESMLIVFCFVQVAPIRPIPFTEDSVIFELKDGRVSKS